MSAPAPRSCPAGHLQYDASARFCGECGVPLEGAAEPLAFCAAHPDVGTRHACPRCGTFACEACLRALTDGQVVCFRCAERGEQALPWDRADVGRLRAFWRTSLAILQRPNVTFTTAAPSASLGSSVAFALLANFAGAITTMALYVAIFGIAIAVALMSPGREISAAGMLGVAGSAFAAVFIVFPIAITGYTLLRAGMDHLLLRLLRAGPGPFAVTLRAHALSIAPAIIGLIPVCGLYVWPIWSVVVRVFAYRGLHRISTTHAVIAALALPILGTVVGVGAYVALLAFSMNRAVP